MDDSKEITEKWLWMMNWCKENKVAPANDENWKRAEEEWIKKR